MYVATSSFEGFFAGGLLVMVLDVVAVDWRLIVGGMAGLKTLSSDGSPCSCIFFLFPVFHICGL